ncbi:hypothetical protein LWI29_026977 [Acer saccharum]|uniref:Uncharacterized protein n=1 Tax=Acer saccharum TaxID=4024 RepID=A0AA39RRQ7_ACESA|nr:hypothetical protein LWI29_026977 [Acer saccharum]
MMRPNNNAVIISYYVESPAVRSHLQKMKRQSFSKKPQTTRKLGSDRRLELLAYANDLRKTGSQQINPPGKRSTSKPKRRLKSILKELAFGCHCNKGWNYGRDDDS